MIEAQCTEARVWEREPCGALAMQAALTRLKERIGKRGKEASLRELLAEVVLQTLEPGDVIATGTPDGIARMERGDVVECTISGVETLTNRVV